MYGMTLKKMKMHVSTQTRGTLRRLEPRDVSICWGWCWYPRGKVYRYYVAEPYSLELSDGRRILLKPGMLTDGATCAPDLGDSYLYHDKLYCTHTFEDDIPCSREEADAVMEAVLRREGRTVYASIFSFFSWLNPFYVFSSAWKSAKEMGLQYHQDY